MLWNLAGGTKGLEAIRIQLLDQANKSHAAVMKCGAAPKRDEDSWSQLRTSAFLIKVQFYAEDLLSGSYANIRKVRI